MTDNTISRERFVAEVVAICTGKKSVGQIVEQYKPEAEENKHPPGAE